MTPETITAIGFTLSLKVRADESISQPDTIYRSPWAPGVVRLNAYVRRECVQLQLCLPSGHYVVATAADLSSAEAALRRTITSGAAEETLRFDLACDLAALSRLEIR